MQRMTVRFGAVFMTDPCASKPYGFTIRTPDGANTLWYATDAEAEASRARSIAAFAAVGHDVIDAATCA